MPKRRCSNPMKRKHTSKSDQVTKITEPMVEKFREFLPEFKWENDLFLCNGCRVCANKTLRQRQTAEAVVVNLREVIEQRMQDPEDEDGKARKNKLLFTLNSILPKMLFT